MNIQKQKNKKYKNRLLIISVFITCLLGAAVSCFFIFNKINNSKSTSSRLNSESRTIDASPPSNEQRIAGSSVKEKAIEQDTSSNGDSSVTIIAFRKDISTVKIDTTINRVLSEGTCTLTITSGTSKKIYTADIQPLANYSTCKGFEIPVSELGLGDWQINISFVSGLVKGSATTTIEVK